MINFYDAVKSRRSRYSICAESTVSDDKLISIVEEAVREVPSPFNSQSSRAVVLLKDSHRLLWNITLETLKERVAEEIFPKTREKINSFAAGYGTILYFEDQNTVRDLESQFPAYKDNFALWSHQSNGMLQYVVWTALAVEGMGATVQHYNPIINSRVREAFSLPEEWLLLAQMPFGKPTAEAQEKNYAPIAGRVKVFK